MKIDFTIKVIEDGKLKHYSRIFDNKKDYYKCLDDFFLLFEEDDCMVEFTTQILLPEQYQQLHTN